MTPLTISPTVTIPAQELAFTAVRASGPGGQNVNKVASKVELRFDLAHTRALDADTCARLRVLAGGRLDSEGRVLIVSQLTRDQIRNLDDALEKLRVLIVKALERPTVRRATRPSRRAKARRVNDKRLNSAKKRDRKPGSDD